MIELIRARHLSINHRYYIYKIYTENIIYTKSKIRPSWEDHCNWYKSIFEKEDVYIILHQNIKIGYVRIKKENKKISIALFTYYQNMGYGSEAIKQLKEKPLIAKVHKNNKRGIHFFHKNNIPVEVIE